MPNYREKNVNDLRAGHIVIIHNESLDRNTNGIVLNYWQNGNVLVAVPKLGVTMTCPVEELEHVGAVTLYTSSDDGEC